MDLVDSYPTDATALSRKSLLDLLDDQPKPKFPNHFGGELLVIRNYRFISDDSVTFTILNVGRKDVPIVSAYINGETATLEPNVSRKMDIEHVLFLKMLQPTLQ